MRVGRVLHTRVTIVHHHRTETGRGGIQGPRAPWTLNPGPPTSMSHDPSRISVFPRPRNSPPPPAPTPGHPDPDTRTDATDDRRRRRRRRGSEGDGKGGAEGAEGARRARFRRARRARNVRRTRAGGRRVPDARVQWRRVGIRGHPPSLLEKAKEVC